MRRYQFYIHPYKYLNHTLAFTLWLAVLSSHIANKNKGFFDEKEELPHRETVLDAESVLMKANSPNKIIQIGDYIDWLNCNYGLGLENNSKYDSSTGYSHPNMDMCVG